MVELTKEDWEEIYYALETKRTRIADGEYGDGEIDQEWIEHLDKIMRKIGLEGEDAAKLGVNNVS